jgi:hypothetical protein
VATIPVKKTNRDDVVQKVGPAAEGSGEANTVRHTGRPTEARASEKSLPNSINDKGISKPRGIAIESGSNNFA